jgi:AraC-like DNA-binding protein
LEAASAQRQAQDFLLGGLEVRASLFHLGQYCGVWEASLNGPFRPGFHLLLGGHCWLHMPGRDSIALAQGDAVFFLRDQPHMLTPRAQSPDFSQPLRRQDMLPLDEGQADATALACGFFDFGQGLSALLLRNLPDVLIIRSDDSKFESAHVLFRLLVDEARQHGEGSSALLSRLAELLLFYALRGAALDGAAQLHGLFTLTREPAMARVVAAIAGAPQRAWSTEDMAAVAHMSRASFHRHFALLSGMTPAALLLHVRVRLACERLRQGQSVEQAADAVGYQSVSAFTRAFTRVTGLSPAAWKRGA